MEITRSLISNLGILVRGISKLQEFLENKSGNPLIFGKVLDMFQKKFAVFISPGANP